MKITKFPSLKENWLLFLLLLVILLCFYLFLSQFLMEQNFYPSVDSQIPSRVLSDKLNSKGFLESNSFDIPLFLYYSYWINPQWPSFFSIIVGGFAFAFLVLFVLENFITRLLRIFLPLVLIFLPSSLFVVTNQPLIALIILFFSLTLYFLLDFYTTQRVFYLFMAAITFGLQFYIQFQFFWLGLLIILFFLVTYAKSGLIFNYLITTLFPLLFFVLSWFFLIWIFQGNVRLFAREVFEIDFQNGVKCLGDCFRENIKHRWPIMLFYLFILLKVGKFKNFFLSPLFLSFISPFIMIFILSSSGNSTNSSVFITLSIINLIILFPYLGPLINEKRNKFIMLLFLILILVYDLFSFALMRTGKEGDFFMALEGHYKDTQIEEYRLVAGQLERFSSILTDDMDTFPVLYFFEGDGKIINEASPLYKSTLVNPSYFTDAYLYMKTQGSQILDIERIADDYPVKVFESEHFVIRAFER